MRLIQRKSEAYWFYSVVSQVYDRWVNPLFWTEPMRDASLALAHLDRDQDVVDVGAGTGFTTTGIVVRADPARVLMVDQSPHQLAKARRKPWLDGVRKELGDAEAIPLPDDAVDRYVSAGSIEYWPDPQRAICEAYRVVRAGGRAVVVGPVRRTHPLARLLSDAWMLFPSLAEYRAWMRGAGFVEIEEVVVAPAWWSDGWDAYGVAIAGVVPEAGPSPLALPAPCPPESRTAMWRSPVRLVRFALGSLAGATFIPFAVVASLVKRGRGAS